MEAAFWTVTAGVVLAVVLRGVPWVTRRAVRDVVAETVKPLADDLRAHMAAEEAARRELNDKLADIKAEFVRNELEHVEFRSRIERLGG